MAVLLLGDGLSRGVDIRADFKASDFFWMEGLSFAPSFYYAADLFSIGQSALLQFVGSNFTVNSENDLTAGTITRMLKSDNGTLIWDFQSISLTVAQLDVWANADDSVSALNALLAGADDIGGSNFGDTITGLAGNDRIWGHGGNDVLFGESGNDFLRGGPGNDTILGGADHDTIAAGPSINSINGDSGIDTLLVDGARRVTSLTFTAEGSFTLSGDSFTSYRGNAVSPRESTSFGGIENFAFSDGRLVFAVNDVAMQVMRMYHTATGTAGDPYGFNWWIDQLSAGTTLRTMANSFNSNEFTAKYGALTNTQFVNQIYQNSAGRAPTSGELSFWTTQLNNGMTRGDAMLSFSEYVETKSYVSSLYSAGIWDQDGATASIARLYQATLNRRPDEAGLSGWRAEIDNGKSLLDITPGFLNSTEFNTLYGSTTNTQFITLLYNNVLNRAPDTPGLNGWLSQLDSGALSRGQVVLGFSESLEFRLNTMSWIEGGIIFA